MPYAFLTVTLVGAVAVVLAYRPIRREPFTVLSFTCGWIAGELAFQNIIWQAAATALFIWFGALSNWAGWLGLAVAVAGWVGLIGLGIAGRRAAGVTAAALPGCAARPSRARPADRADLGQMVAGHPCHPLQVAGRAGDVQHRLLGRRPQRHRLDVYQSRLAPPGKAPVMVYIHGGAWMIGEKREQGKPMMYELVARGWVCVAINYRLSPQGHLAGPHRRRQAGRGLGQGAHR